MSDKTCWEVQLHIHIPNFEDLSATELGERLTAHVEKLIGFDVVEIEVLNVTEIVAFLGTFLDIGEFEDAQ